MSTSHHLRANLAAARFGSGAARSLFDAPLAAQLAATNIPMSALPPELRPLSVARPEDVAATLTLLKTLAKSALEDLGTLPPLPRHTDLYVSMSALQ